MYTYIQSKKYIQEFYHRTMTPIWIVYQYPSIVQKINKLWYVKTMQYYTIKRIKIFHHCMYVTIGIIFNIMRIQNSHNLNKRQQTLYESKNRFMMFQVWIVGSII